MVTLCESGGGGGIAAVPRRQGVSKLGWARLDHFWRFPARHGGTPSYGWLIKFISGKIHENPNRTWMITRGSPILGHLHITNLRTMNLNQKHQWALNS